MLEALEAVMLEDNDRAPASSTIAIEDPKRKMRTNTIGSLNKIAQITQSQTEFNFQIQENPSKET